VSRFSLKASSSTIFKHFKKVLKVLSSTSSQVLAPYMIIRVYLICLFVLI